MGTNLKLHHMIMNFSKVTINNLTAHNSGTFLQNKLLYTYRKKNIKKDGEGILAKTFYLVPCHPTLALAPSISPYIFAIISILMLTNI